MRGSSRFAIRTKQKPAGMFRGNHAVPTCRDALCWPVEDLVLRHALRPNQETTDAGTALTSKHSFLLRRGRGERCHAILDKFSRNRVGGVFSISKPRSRWLWEKRPRSEAAFQYLLGAFPDLFSFLGFFLVRDRPVGMSGDIKKSYGFRLSR